MIALQQKARQAGFILSVLLAFFLPVSTSAITATALLIALCWLLEGGFRRKWREICANPVCRAVLLYLLLMVAGLCWVDHWGDGLVFLKQQWKTFLFPIFLTTVRYERRTWQIGAFIAGTALVMALIWSARLGLLDTLGLSLLAQAKLIQVHIVYTPMLALASYFLFHGLIWGGIRGPLRWCMALLAALFVCTVLATDGRAGHLVFFILLILLLFQYFRGKVYKAILLTLVLIPLLFAAAYNLSPHFQARLDHAIEDIQIFHKNQDTSVGLRFVRWRNSWEIIRQSPWLGSGTGGFTAAYQEVHQRLSPALPMIDNPHNQYLFVLTQWGILGLLLLLNIFFAQIRQAGLNADGRGRMQLAFSLFFLTIMLTESYLSVHGTGFLFSLLGAVLFKKERLDQPEMAARTEDIASSGSLAVR